MAGGSFGGEDFGANAQINVTPSVDVMLVLLVIFMVTAPMLQQGVEVSLPKATSAPLKGTNEQIVVSVDKNENIYLGAGNKMSASELVAKLKVILERKPVSEQKVYIKADEGLRYGVLMDLMGELHQGGIDQVGLVSAPPEKTSKK